MNRTLLLSAMVATALLTPAIYAQVLEDKPRADQPKTTPPDQDRDESSAASRDDRSKTTTTENRSKDESSIKVERHRRASQVIGMNIQNRQDEKVGAVNDLVFDLSARRVIAVVISSGGFLGIADELSIVPPSSLKLNPEEDAFTADITKDQLTHAPHFQGTAYPDVNDAKFMLSVYKAYDAEPYLESLRTDDDTDETNRRVVRASELLGIDVKNHQDESIGDIHEIVLNGSLDRVASVVVSSGGFLGLGDTLSVIPVEAVTAKKDAVLVNATKETLEQSPRFTAETWPETMTDPSYLVDIYAPYQFRSDTLSDLDINAETDKNRTDAEKDKATAPVTAQDQSNSEGDVAITTRIRRKIVSHDDFSFAAKNISVITVGGEITLSGVVSSKEEMKEIVKIAEEESGSDEVTNQLTVKE